VDWIFDHPQILLLIILGVGSMLKSTIEGRAKKAAERDFTEERETRPPIDQDTSYRKVMPSVPPPVQQSDRPPPLPGTHHTPSPKKRRKVKPASIAPASFSAAEEAAGILKHQRDLAERLRQIRDTKATTTGGAAATRARVASKGTKSPQTLGPVSLRKRLANPAEVRRAFVLKELLDRPVGLR
jgi:hypothetical protein